MTDEHLPRPATGAHNPIADDDPRGEAGTPLAPPPIETPGPSVTPPARPASETEREEWADATRPTPDQDLIEIDDPIEELIAEEESAAGAEAREIGGPAPASARDPWMQPVYDAGGGEREGFEQAEDDLIENATHGDGRANPLRDAIDPEVEADRSGAEYGEADEEDLDDRW
jgi:hypothetical protein